MIGIGINLEFVRHADKSFEWGVERPPPSATPSWSPWCTGAASSSAKRVTFTCLMLDDPYRVKKACENVGVRLSGLSAHTPCASPKSAPST